MNFTPLNQFGQYEGFAMITKVEKRVTAKGKDYLDLILSDSSGEISAKFWDYDVALHGEFHPDMLIKVRGTISQYKGSDQLRVEKIRRALADDHVRIEDFVRSAEYDSEYMYNALIECVEGFTDADIKKLVLYLLEQHKAEILIWPAAYKLHHAIRGGLLMHTLSIVRLAEGVCKVYPFVDKDLLLGGAVLHDIAKTMEYEVGESGIASGYTPEGNLIGHLVKGAMYVSEAEKVLGTPHEKSVLLQHMLLSHHGNPEFGAAVRPSFLEAELLSILDNMDAEVYQIKEALGSVSERNFTNRLWALDDRKMYNHALGDMGKNVDLK